MLHLPFHQKCHFYLTKITLYIPVVNKLVDILGVSSSMSGYFKKCFDLYWSIFNHSKQTIPTCSSSGVKRQMVLQTYLYTTVLMLQKFYALHWGWIKHYWYHFSVLVGPWWVSCKYSIVGQKGVKGKHLVFSCTQKANSKIKYSLIY